MNETAKIILVARATGKQGGATAARLLAGGWRARALCRDTSTAVAGSDRGSFDLLTRFAIACDVVTKNFVVESLRVVSRFVPKVRTASGAVAVQVVTRRGRQGITPGLLLRPLPQPRLVTR